MIIIYSRFTTNYPSILFNMILFVYRDCVCVILLWIMTPNTDANLKANLWINLQKRQSVCVKLKKKRSDDCAKVCIIFTEISLTAGKHYPKGKGSNPRDSWRRYVFCLICGNTTMLLENVQRVDCWYVKLIWFEKLRFVMLELDSEMEDIQL